MSERLKYTESADGTMILSNGGFFVNAIMFDAKKNKELIDLLNSTELSLREKAIDIFDQQERLNDLEKRISRLEPIVKHYEKRLFSVERTIDDLDIFKKKNEL